MEIDTTRWLRRRPWWSAALLLGMTAATAAGADGTPAGADQPVADSHAPANSPAVTSETAPSAEPGKAAPVAEAKKIESPGEPNRSERATEAVSETDQEPTAGAAASSNSETRTREGIVLTNILGEFREAGGRVVFTTADGAAYTVLENLALERIGRVLDDRNRRTWNVSGQVTEYHGGNYLLVTRAVMRSKAANRK